MSKPLFESPAYRNLTTVRLSMFGILRFFILVFTSQCFRSPTDGSLELTSIRFVYTPT